MILQSVVPGSPSQAGSKPGDAPLGVYLLACGLYGPRGFKSLSRRHRLWLLFVFSLVLFRRFAQHDIKIPRTQDSTLPRRFST